MLPDTSKRRPARSYLSGLDGLDLCGPLFEPLSFSKLFFLTKDFSVLGKTEKEKKDKGYQAF